MELSLGAGCAQKQRYCAGSQERLHFQGESRGKSAFPGEERPAVPASPGPHEGGSQGRQAGWSWAEGPQRLWPFCPRTGERAGKGSWGSGASGATFPSLAPASWCPESWRDSTPYCPHRHGRGPALGPVPSWPGHQPRPKPAATLYQALKPQFLVSSMRGHLFTPGALAHRKHPVKIRSLPALTVLTHGHCRGWAPSPPARSCG